MRLCGLVWSHLRWAVPSGKVQAASASNSKKVGRDDGQANARAVVGYMRVTPADEIPILTTIAAITTNR